MKFNFRKIATVLGSTLLIGSTLGVAAAASYPAPFISGGAADVAVVVGSNAALSDAVAAAQVGSNLATQLAANTASGSTGATGATATGGDNYKIEKTSTKFTLGKGITDVVSATVTDDNLPTLLADGKYVDNDNDEFDYTQKITLANSTLAMFDDNDYKADTPTIGVRIPSGSNVLNYTMTFTDIPDWGDLSSTNLKFLGKSYFILSTDGPATNTTITLLDSAQSSVLNEGESQTLTVNGTSYNVSLGFISGSGSSGNVKLLINGVPTNTLQQGQTQKLSDGAYVGIKTILSQDYAGGAKQVEFSIGSGKLKMVSGQDIEMNDNTISGLKSTFTSNNGLSAITLAWNADGDKFAAAGSDIEMPGFKSVKLSFGGMSYPVNEAISVEAGSDTYIALKNFPLKDTTYDINLLYTTDNANITGIGKDASNLLRTVNSGNLTFDADTDSYFVASWNDTSNAESYLMRATDFKVVSTVNKTTIQYRKGDSWTKVKEDAQPTDSITLGNVALTVGVVNYSDRTVTIVPGTGVSFNTLYSKDGLRVLLPYQNATNQTVTTNASCSTANGGSGVTWYAGLIGPVTVSNATLNAICYQTTFKLQMIEEDKNGNIGASGREFNATIGFNSASNPQVSVTGVETNAGSTFVAFAQQQSTKIWESYMYTPLASKLLWDKSGDQYSLGITYHGGESFGNVFLAAPGVTVSETTTGTTTGGSATALGQVTVYDNEISSVQAKNLVVVGGSCINTVAAKLLGSDTPVCGAAFTTKTTVGDGQYLIQVLASPYTTGKVAMLVAGYNAADTTKAVTYLVNNAPATTVGTKLVGTSATQATAVTNTA